MKLPMIELSRSDVFEESSLAESAKAVVCDERFAAIVMRQSRFAFRIAYSVLRNASDAEDVIQETFLKLYRSGAWRHIDDERAFLARAVWRMAVERRPKRRGESAPTQSEAVAASPEAAAMAADLNAAIWRLIDALPEELRQPLTLSAIDEMTSRQIAAVMGIPEGTVRTRLMRARQILKQKLATMGADHHGK